MNDSLSRDASGRTVQNVTTATWAGLFIAFFGILIVRWAVSLFYPTFSFAATLWKESLIWLCVIALLFNIRRGERLPLRSIGLGAAPLKSSILWGGILTVLCGLIGSVVAGLTHFKGGETGEALAKFPLWLVVLVVLRAGVVEELFYRGYAIERLQALGLNRYWAGIIPLLIFGFGHVTNGWANVVLALALGAVLTAVYLWRRDLVANMIGHFMIDLISVLLPRFLSHSYRQRTLQPNAILLLRVPRIVRRLYVLDLERSFAISHSPDAPRFVPKHSSPST